MKRFLSVVLLVAITVSSVLSCQQGPEEIRVSSISLSKSALELSVGDQASLDATISPDNATNKRIRWSSSKESVVTVTPEGIVEAVSGGTAFITATSEDSGVSAKCEITVKEKVISITGIALNKTSLSLKEGEEFTLEATITPANATNKDLSWTSDNEAVATVSAEGVVKAIRAGTARITATTVDQGKSASCTVVVATKMSAVTGDATHISCRNAKLSGKVTLSQTTSTNLSFGVLYSTSSGVLLGSATQLEAKDFDADYNYTIDSGVLEPETTYYYRSYIIQNDEVEYGETKSFKTLAVSSMIQTLDAGDVYPKEATLNAMLDLTDCKYSSIEYGFELTPEGGKAKTMTADNLADKAFSYRDETLVKNTSYSYVAYVKLDDILYKGETKTFTTASIQASVTAEVSDIQYNSATISGSLNVQSEGSFSKSAVLYYSNTENTVEGLKSNGIKKTLTLGAAGSYAVALSSLSSSTSYNYVVVAKVDDVEFVSSIGNFLTPALPSEPLVDLGLSVKWASCNLGASKATEYGGYYQWAGTKDVSDTGIYIDWSNCPYHTGSSSTLRMTKYNTQSSYGTVDNKKVLEAKDDAASVALGGKWRIPTYAEWGELRENCSWTWITIDGVKGYKVQSKKPGYTDNWIFLPAAGWRDVDNRYNVGSIGCYWSSSLYTAVPYLASNMFFSSGEVGRRDNYRYYGHSVRPVSE
ncbi:MAG: Ig-like domain-containing protein [Bacteroidales bacterium]|nr:Ig-like domain-containing protein [Bacteroidales bacterium]